MKPTVQTPLECPDLGRFREMKNVSRRDFLKLAGVLGAGFVITAYSADIKKVFAQVQSQQVHLVWLQLAGDSGCSISMLQAYNPDLISSVVDLGVSVDFWSPFMTPDYELGSRGGSTPDTPQRIPPRSRSSTRPMGALLWTSSWSRDHPRSPRRPVVYQADTAWSGR